LKNKKNAPATCSQATSPPFGGGGGGGGGDGVSGDVGVADSVEDCFSNASVCSRGPSKEAFLAISSFSVEMDIANIEEKGQIL
jgi:hypothetical protein